MINRIAKDHKAGHRGRLRTRLLKAGRQGGTICPHLALAFATAGGTQKLKCWNTEGIFRLIQSIPSPKAEPFKRWLARVGKERRWSAAETINYWRNQERRS